MGLPSWSKWEMVEQFTAANIAKILIVSGIAINAAFITNREDLETVAAAGAVIHQELRTTIDTTTTDLMEQVNTNYAQGEINGQIRTMNVSRTIVQGQLDMINRVIESRPDAGPAYLISRDNYRQQLREIDAEVEGLKIAARR